MFNRQLDRFLQPREQEKFIQEYLKAAYMLENWISDSACGTDSGHLNFKRTSGFISTTSVEHEFRLASSLTFMQIFLSTSQTIIFLKKTS